MTAMRRAPKSARHLAITAATLAVVCLAHIAAAKPPAAKPPAGPPGPKDKQVLRIDADALGHDYLETNFIKAEKKLQQAIGTCGKKLCSPPVLAQLHRDLAIVYIAGLGKVDAGKAALKTAFELDPQLELDPDYSTPDVKKVWNQIRGGKGKPVEEPKSAKQGGFAHTPVTEQAVGTPVPLFAKFGGDAAKLRLWYKPVGAERWASLNMELASSGFTGEIPCSAVGRAGELKYFIEALGENEESLDKDGSRTEPHVVNIVKELTGDAPHLPDVDAPEACKNLCKGDDCEGGEAKPKGPRKNWFSFSIQQDLAIVGAASGVCSGEIQVNGSYSCFRAAGSQYHGNPIADPGDNVNGGLAPATTRLMIGYDRVLIGGLVLGARLGYVIHGLGPRADGGSTRPPLPIHAELRLAWWFGSDVFSTAGFRPYVFIAGGVAQVDSKFNVVVHEDPSIPPPPSQIDNPPAQALSAYRRMGQGFAGGGAGIMYAFTPAVGLFLDAKYMALFPTAGNALAPEFGIAVGF
jgi:hypothetical protein